jgi:hypothetical protein
VQKKFPLDPDLDPDPGRVKTMQITADTYSKHWFATRIQTFSFSQFDSLFRLPDYIYSILSEYQKPLTYRYQHFFRHLIFLFSKTAQLNQSISGENMKNRLPAKIFDFSGDLLTCLFYELVPAEGEVRRLRGHPLLRRYF